MMMDLEAVNTAEIKSELEAMPGAGLVVCDQLTYESAGNILRDIQTLKKNVKDKFAEPKKRAAEAHKAICALENELLAKVTERETEIRGKMSAYYAQEQARIAAEQERKRKEAEELARLAFEAETAGDTDTAMEAAVLAAAQEVAVTEKPKASGVSMREVWTARVTDPLKVPREYLEINMKALNAVAKATKGAVQIPGVVFEKSYSSTARGW